MSGAGRIAPAAGVFLLLACGGIGAATDPPSETPDAPDAPADLAVTILSPSTGSYFFLGDAIDFEASVTDGLGAPLAAEVEWRSDLSGKLGTGKRLELPNAGNCPTLPVNFRDTDPNPHGPQAHRTYHAR